MPEPCPPIPLLVSTYESPRLLELTLRSVLHQSLMPDEVLVADDGSGATTRAVIEREMDDLARRGSRLRHIWHQDDGFRLGAVRNRALAQTDADYVIQVDGDVILHPFFVEEHVAWARPGYFLCGRRGDLTVTRTGEIQRSDEIPASFRPRDLERLTYALHVPALTPIFLRQYADSCTKGVMGSNLSYWRVDALRINGYDESFQGWGKEDNDFVLRLMNAGVRRRTVVWSALQYHLFHGRSDTSQLIRNSQRLEETRSSGRIRCDRGITQE